MPNGDEQADATQALQLQPALPDDGLAGGRRLLVLEGTRGGLLTLLAHSAVSDLTGIDGPVQVQTAVSPEQGIEALSAAPHQCIVLDLGLPDASAFAFLERLREEPELRDVPVLAHTRDKLDSAQARLARLRFGSQPLELLPSLDELRERITLAPVRGSARARSRADQRDGGRRRRLVSRRRPPGMRRCAAGGFWSSTTTRATSSP